MISQVATAVTASYGVVKSRRCLPTPKILPYFAPTLGHKRWQFLAVAVARNHLFDAPHMVIFPSIALVITVLSFNFLGDALRDWLDPRNLG